MTILSLSIRQQNVSAIQKRLRPRIAASEVMEHGAWRRVKRAAGKIRHTEIMPSAYPSSAEIDAFHAGLCSGDRKCVDP